MDKYGPKSKFEKISSMTITGYKKLPSEKEMRKYLNSISEISVFSPEEEKYWFTRYNNAKTKEEQEEIRNTIVMHNLKLVATMAASFQKEDLDFFEFVQEGFFALIEAIDKFDLERDTKFSTFAVNWIQKYMINSFYDSKRPISWNNHSRRINRAIENLEESYPDVSNENITITNEIIKEIKSEIKASDKTIINVLGQKNMLNIDEEVYSEEGEYLGRIMDIIPSDEDLEQNIMDRKYVQELKEYFDSFPMKERNKDIIRRKFGVGCEKEQTFEEIGKHYNMSFQNASRIYNEGIQRIRKSREEKK